ncbi:hypothetical protein ACC691_39445, partial [Rhizobium johnstonii]|uniref:hypothetical protein n=1 Tax=Rhizobium johnstonii TaxID=3019933 RepID=UPI003F9AB28E
FLALAIAAAFGLVRGRMMALADRMAPTERMRAIGSLRAAAVLAALPVLFFFWGGRDIALLTEHRNADWNRTLAWVGANVAHDDVVLV